MGLLQLYYFSDKFLIICLYAQRIHTRIARHIYTAVFRSDCFLIDQFTTHIIYFTKSIYQL